MDEFDDIEEFYNDQVNQFSSKSLDNIWNRLDNSLNASEIGEEKWYKQRVDGFSMPPSAHVWGKLSVNLDTENVWTRLVKTLNKRDKIIFWWRFGLGSLSLVALLLLGWFWKDSQESDFKNEPNYTSAKLLGNKVGSDSCQTIESLYSQTIAKDMSGKNEVLVNSMTTSNSLTDHNHPTKEIHSAVFSDTSHSGVFHNVQDDGNTTVLMSNDLKTVKEVDSLTGLGTEDSMLATNLSYLKGHPAKMIHLPLSNQIVLADSSNYASSHKVKNELYIYGGLTNSWFINSDTYHSLRANSLTYTIPKFTETVGIGLGHWLSDFNGVDLSLSYQRSGHKYMEYMEGHSYERSVDLFYIIACVNLKHEIFKGNKRILNDRHTFVHGGLYYGYSFRNSLTIKGVSYLNTGLFKSHDLGISMGIEKKRKNLSGMITITQGLVNLYNDPYDSGFNNTFNFSLTCGLKYVICKN